MNDISGGDDGGGGDKTDEEGDRDEGEEVDVGGDDVDEEVDVEAPSPCCARISKCAADERTDDISDTKDKTTARVRNLCWRQKGRHAPAHDLDLHEP